MNTPETTEERTPKTTDDICAQDADRQQDEEPVFDAVHGDEQDSSVVPAVTYQLGEGHQLVMFEVVGSDGQRAYPILEKSTCRNVSLFVDDLRLAQASPLEVFNAVAKEDEPLPNILASQFGTEPRLGPRGWLRNELPATQGGINFCSSVAFNSFLQSKPHQKKYVLTNERPTEHPNRWTPYHDCLGIIGDACNYTWYRFTGRVYNVDRFYARVAACSLDYHPSFETNYGYVRNHVGPEVFFAYRDTNNVAGLAASYDFKSVGESAAWIFNSGNNWDWFVKIRLARPQDKFNIGMAWSRF